jgi:hypothetical protein
MKALSLWNPWANLVAMGQKKVETRDWKTDYRGPLAIHATAGKPHFLGRSAEARPLRDELADVFNCRRDSDERGGMHVDAHLRTLPKAAVLCIVRLVAIEETRTVRETLDKRELIFGNYDDGRYAFFFEMIEVFDTPIPAKGNRKIWNWDPLPIRKQVGQ